MLALFHSGLRLSMKLAGVAAVLCCSGPLLARTPPEASASPYFGRWTISENRPAFTARGRSYKTIDIAPCGRDFCGVSVDDRGSCGTVLFRFLWAHRGGEDALRGHGRWGDARKNLLIYTTESGEGAVGETGIKLYLGDGYDFGDRSGNMPRFQGSYRRLGPAHCAAH